MPPTLIAAVCATPAFGQQLPSEDRLDPRSLVAFADDFLPSEMAKRHIPGAVIAVVARGQTILAQGYGFADLEIRRAVDPDRTGFYIGSVSKIVTTTAALQLVERGHLAIERRTSPRRPTLFSTS